MIFLPFPFFLVVSVLRPPAPGLLGLRLHGSGDWLSERLPFSAAVAVGEAVRLLSAGCCMLAQSDGMRPIHGFIYERVQHGGGLQFSMVHPD